MAQKCGICGEKMGLFSKETNVGGYIPETFRKGNSVICSKCAKEIEITCSVCGNVWSVNYDCNILKCPACEEEKRKKEREEKVKEIQDNLRENFLKVDTDDFDNSKKVQLRECLTMEDKADYRTWTVSFEGEIDQKGARSFFLLKEQAIQKTVALNLNQNLILYKQSGDALVELPFLEQFNSGNFQNSVFFANNRYYLSKENMIKILDSSEDLFFKIGDHNLLIPLVTIHAIVRVMLDELNNQEEIAEADLYSKFWIYSQAVDSDTEIDQIKLFENDFYLMSLGISKSSQDGIHKFINVEYANFSVNKEQIDSEDRTQVMIKIGDNIKEIQEATTNKVNDNFSKTSVLVDQETMKLIREIELGDSIKIRITGKSGNKQDLAFEVDEWSLQMIEFFWRQYSLE